MIKNIKEVNKIVKDSSDNINCFARISKTKCNALKSKSCKNCSFYKNKVDVPNYKALLEESGKR